MTPAEQLDIIRSFEAVESMDDEAVSKRDLEVGIFDWYQQFSLSLSIWNGYVLTFDKTVFVQLHNETMLMWLSNEPVCPAEVCGMQVQGLLKTVKI